MAKFDNARGRGASRRGLLEGRAVSALPLPPSVPEADPALPICERWLRLGEEQRRLTLEWQAIESRFFRQETRSALPHAEQRRAPESARMRRIDAYVARLHREQEDLFPLLQTTSAQTRAGLMAKLDVVLSLLEIADHPQAHALFRGCQRDIDQLWV
jgi:hypothetical protein